MVRAADSTRRPSDGAPLGIGPMVRNQRLESRFHAPLTENATQRLGLVRVYARGDVDPPGAIPSRNGTIVGP
jgi:hypothetical protein